MRAAGALEPDPAVRCPDDMAARFLGGLNVTTLAKHRLTRPLYLRRLKGLIPGGYAYEIARCKFIDDVVLAEVDAGLDELVLLGAGFDSRAYRLADRLGGVRVLEVDHPATQASKRARLGRLPDLEADHVTFVPVDFNRQELAAELARAGHDEAAATLFVWSGVSPYLPEEAVEKVLTWVGSHSSPRTSIVFDATWAEMVDGTRDYYGAAELLKAVAAVGEPLRWGIPEGRVEETLERFGLRAERVLDAEGATAAYLTRSDGTPFERPYGFGVLLQARVAAA